MTRYSVPIKKLISNNSLFNIKRGLTQSNAFLKSSKRKPAVNGYELTVLCSKLYQRVCYTQKNNTNLGVMVIFSVCV